MPDSALPGREEVPEIPRLPLSLVGLLRFGWLAGTGPGIAELELRATGLCVRVRLRCRARLFRAYNFYCFSRRGRIAALVSGEVWRCRWRSMLTAFQSCLALAQSVSCGHARSFAQMHAILVQGEVSEFGVSPWRVKCIWQLGVVYCYV